MLVLFFAVLLFSCNQKQELSSKKDYLHYVDPTKGNVGHILQPTRPTVQLPNQMTRMTPDRADYMDDQISSFPLNVISHRVAKAFYIKPIAGEVNAGSWNKRLTWDHDLEINRPWYYKTELVDEEITVKYTAGAKTGIYRFTFPGQAKNILLGHYYPQGNFSVLSENIVAGVAVWLIGK